MSDLMMDARMLAKMFLAGAKNLESRQEAINEQNVFPVPDGDTGTNMTATIMSAAREVAQDPEASMEALCKAISSGSLRGARGNSGVILSQLLRGFTKVVKKHEIIDAPLLADAFEKAVETAYKAVMVPKEGTILTVARGASDKARELADAGVRDPQRLFQGIIEHTEGVLEKTPELLPVLKEAGVVDSGGMGLLELLRGAYDGFLGRGIPFDAKPGAGRDGAEREETRLKYAYCVVLRTILKTAPNKKQMSDIRNFLTSVGDQVKATETDEGIYVHIHTSDPGLVLQRALLFGDLRDVVVHDILSEGHVDPHPGRPVTLESMEHRAEGGDRGIAPEKKEIGFVGVCAGSGMADIFKSLGCDEVIEGGQTMNPSTEDILEACARVPAETVFLLPNNKNIILAAEQAARMCKDRKLMVIPTRTVPQGIVALVNYIPDEPAEANASMMQEAIDTVATGEVTYAVRDTVLDGVSIRQGDYMGIADGGILHAGKDRSEVALATLEKMMRKGQELVGIYYGADVEEAEAAELRRQVCERFPGVDVDLQFGGQPVYSYILSAE